MIKIENIQPNENKPVQVVIVELSVSGKSRQDAQQMMFSAKEKLDNIKYDGTNRIFTVLPTKGESKSTIVFPEYLDAPEYLDVVDNSPEPYDDMYYKMKKHCRIATDLAKCGWNPSLAFSPSRVYSICCTHEDELYILYMPEDAVKDWENFGRKNPAELAINETLDSYRAWFENFSKKRPEMTYSHWENSYRVHKCELVNYGNEEKRCVKCGYITFNSTTKTDQEIISQMIADGYPLPDCDIECAK